MTVHPQSVIYCAGDLNLPDICWNSESVCGHSNPLEMNSSTLSLINDCSFTQVVNFPTHCPCILDIVLTNRPPLLLQCTPVAGISDHKMIFASFQVKVVQQNQSKHKIFLWDSGNVDEIKAQLLSFTDYVLNTFSSLTPVEDLWNLLSAKILDLMDKYIPSRFVPNNVKQPWINHNVKKT